jgi:hypothetical protein
MGFPLTFQLSNDGLLLLLFVQAQEIGEIARLNDDMVWALDGLESTSKSAREESLGNLVELLSSRRGRALLHRDGIVGDLMRRLCTLLDVVFTFDMITIC